MTQTNQGALISALQTELGAGFEDRTLEGLWHELWDANSVSGTTFNERMLNYLNEYLGTSYTYLPQAMQAYAENGGFYNWSSIGTWDLTLNPAAQLVNTWSSDGQGLGLIFEGAKPGIYVKDTGTPANDTNITATNDFDAFSAFLTKTAVTPKITRQADGYYKYQAHNLALQSENLATGSWSKVGSAADGATTWGIDASVGITISALGYFTAGAACYLMQGFASLPPGDYTASIEVAKGAVLDGAQLRVATNTTLSNVVSGAGFPLVDLDSGTHVNTEDPGDVEDLGGGTYRLISNFTLTSVTTVYIGLWAWNSASRTTDGSESYTVSKLHVRRAPSVDTYHPTTTAARYSLPIQYDASGAAEGLLVEPAATNLVTYSNDLTNAAWTKSNMTTALTATGPGGAANAATTCTATAGNATALFSITSTSAARVTSVFLKRRTGTGNIDITQDNGAAWTTQAVTSSWAKYELATVTSANPTVGLRIVTSGDAVDVAFFDHELGTVATSPIITAGATVTRTADQLGKVGGLPLSVTTATMYVRAQRPAKDSFAVFMMQYGTPDTNQITLRDSSAALSGIVRNASAGVTMDLGNPTDNPIDTDFKFAIAAEANNGNVAIDGTAKTADTSVTMPANANGIRFHPGAGYSGASMLLKEVLYLPERLPDADLESLTT